MDFMFDEEDQSFRLRLREWLVDKVDRSWEEEAATGGPDRLGEIQRGWDVLLHEGGWSGIWWPTEFGGMGATATQKVIFAEETGRINAPQGYGKVGKRLLGPALMRYGTDEQRERFLPPLLAGEECWCQGFSEPGAGSDLAGLTTRAAADKDGFTINGQKVWTSHARYSEWCFMLARTDPTSKGRDGLSFLLVPVDSPGLEVRPIRQINEQSEFNEVFFDDVRIPRQNIIGDVGNGWHVAMSILAYERGAEQALGKFARTRIGVERFLRQAPSLNVSPEQMGRTFARSFGIQLDAYRLLGNQLAGESPGPMASVVKLYSTETWRGAGASSMLQQTAASYNESWAEPLSDYFDSRHWTISSGTSEVQRNIIARRVLQLASSRS